MRYSLVFIFYLSCNSLFQDPGAVWCGLPRSLVGSNSSITSMSMFVSLKSITSKLAPIWSTLFAFANGRMLPRWMLATQDDLVFVRRRISFHRVLMIGWSKWVGDHDVNGEPRHAYYLDAYALPL